MSIFPFANAFDAYCWAHRLENPEVARALGVTRQAVRVWRLGLDDAEFKRPSANKIQEIFEWSNGRVKPDHWFDLRGIANGNFERRAEQDPGPGRGSSGSFALSTDGAAGLCSPAAPDFST